MLLFKQIGQGLLSAGGSFSDMQKLLMAFFQDEILEAYFCEHYQNVLDFTLTSLPQCRNDLFKHCNDSMHLDSNYEENTKSDAITHYC